MENFQRIYVLAETNWLVIPRRINYYRMCSLFLLAERTTVPMLDSAFPGITLGESVVAE